MNPNVLINFIICLIIFSVLGAIVYLIYLPLKIYLKENGKLTILTSKKVNIAYIFIILLAAIFYTYDGACPRESFYEEEFKYVTLRKIPESAEFISKEASYPDFHGDYCSSALVQFSEKDYQKLLNELNNDPALTPSKEDFGNFEEKQESPGHVVKSFDRKIKGEEDEFLNIQFYDNNTVMINVCIT